jgi:ATP-dependent protease HslVU (ClpYQ) peptidase subunit
MITPFTDVIETDDFIWATTSGGNGAIAGEEAMPLLESFNHCNKCSAKSDG